MTEHDHPSGDPTRERDRETYDEIAGEIDRLMDAAARLQELGADADLPAIERNAKRLEGSAQTLADNVPRELTEE